MKVKYAVFGLLIFFACLFWADSEVMASQPSDFLIRNYTIEIDVYCLEEALQRLANMPGIILSSQVHLQADWGAMDRRLTVDDLERKLADLQALGRVVNMVSHSRNVFAEVADMRSEWQVRSAEYERLMGLLYEVDTIDNFSQIESRLANVIAEMEWLSGRLNSLDFETGTARIGISLFAVDDLTEAVEPTGAFARIGNAFLSSGGMTLAWAQAILIFMVYVSVPFIMFAIIAFCVFYFVLTLRRKREKGGKIDVEDSPASSTE